MKTFKEWLSNRGYTSHADDWRIDCYIQYAIKEIAGSYQYSKPKKYTEAMYDFDVAAARSDGYRSGRDDAMRNINPPIYISSYPVDMRPYTTQINDAKNQGFNKGYHEGHKDGFKSTGVEINRLKRVEAEAMDSYDRGYKMGYKIGYTNSNAPANIAIFSDTTKRELAAARECAMTWLGGEDKTTSAIMKLRKALGISDDDVRGYYGKPPLFSSRFFS